MLWWKETKQVFSHWDIRTQLIQTKTTELGKKIDPTKLINEHDPNDTSIY